MLYSFHADRHFLDRINMDQTWCNYCLLLHLLTQTNSQLALTCNGKMGVWTRREGISGKPATIQHQALFTMSLALRMVCPLNPLWHFSRLLYKNCACTSFIVHSFFSSSSSKNKGSSTSSEKQTQSCTFSCNRFEKFTEN